MRARGSFHGFQSAALVVALVLVVLLTRQSRSLRHELARVRLAAMTPPVGLTVPEFRAITLVGDSVTIGRSPGGQVLLFFNTTCSFCREALPAWRSIVTRIRDEMPELATFGLSAEPDSVLRTYAASNAIDFDVALIPDSNFLLLYRVEGVPITVVVSPSGTVRYGRAGVPSPGAVDSILQAALEGTAGPE